MGGGPYNHKQEQAKKLNGGLDGSIDLNDFAPPRDPFQSGEKKTQGNVDETIKLGGDDTMVSNKLAMKVGVTVDQSMDPNNTIGGLVTALTKEGN